MRNKGAEKPRGMRAQEPQSLLVFTIHLHNFTWLYGALRKKGDDCSRFFGR